MKRAHELYGPSSGHQRDRYHGDHCSCRLLCEAAGTETSSTDYAWCRNVLQRHWGVVCNHLPAVTHVKKTPEPPPHDSRDPLHALLIANADVDAG